MNNTSLPLRKCVACSEMRPKSDLFRLVKVDNIVKLDLSTKADGRGAWICKNRSCIDNAIKKKSFNRSLKCPVSQEVIDKLYLELEYGSR